MFGTHAFPDVRTAPAIAPTQTQDLEKTPTNHTPLCCRRYGLAYLGMLGCSVHERSKRWQILVSVREIIKVNLSVDVVEPTLYQKVGQEKKFQNSSTIQGLIISNLKTKYTNKKS